MLTVFHNVQIIVISIGLAKSASGQQGIKHPAKNTPMP